MNVVCVAGPNPSANWAICGATLRVVDGSIVVSSDDGVVVVRFHGRPNDETFTDYLEQYQSLVDEGGEYVAMYVTDSDARMPSHRHAIRQAKWMKVNQEKTARLCRGLAFVLPSPLMRGFLRAVLQLQPLKVPHQVFRDEEPALSWLRERWATASSSGSDRGAELS